jgi:hypothetical protein
MGTNFKWEQILNQNKFQIETNFKLEQKFKSEQISNLNKFQK